jgi:hypothetical protein
MTAPALPFPTVTPPQERQRWHEMLKNAPLMIVLLYLSSRAPAPVTQLELSENMQIDRKTAASYMRQLSMRNFVAQVSERDGYLLADGSTTFFEMWGKNGHMTLKESLIKDLKTLRKKEGKSHVGTFWTHAENLDAETILSETALLFDGKSVTAFGLTTCPPLTVLAVLAHAYDQRDRLNSPAVFAYRRLQRGQAPDKKYLNDPEAFLPNSFLAALGLQELRVVDVEPASDAADAYLLDDGVEVTPDQRAWQTVKDQLQLEMSIGLFRTWVDPTQAAGFEGDVFLVRVANTANAEWLDARIKATAERLLVGVLNQTVRVAFVVR